MVSAGVAVRRGMASVVTRGAAGVTKGFHVGIGIIDGVAIRPREHSTSQLCEMVVRVTCGEAWLGKV